MLESKSNSGGSKRKLPSWMSARDEENESKKHSSTSSDFSKLLDGVVFVLSGFVNPERSTLRSQALAMGAEYQADWNSGCTLLICAFPNTPKFRQVEADCGTIVSKEWISECYQQKKLVDIDTYIMHAGKPWRRGNIVNEASHVKETSETRNAYKAAEKQMQIHQRVSEASSSKVAPSERVSDVSSSIMKQWVKDDLDETMSWLQSQEEQPEPAEMTEIATQGILTCIQDAIDLLEKNQDIGELKEQWSCIPRIVKKLENLAKTTLTPDSKECLRKQANDYKQIYETELNHLTNKSLQTVKKAKSCKSTQAYPDKGDRGNAVDDEAGFDSDETVEMTEEEIDMAYNLTC